MHTLQIFQKNPFKLQVVMQQNRKNAKGENTFAMQKVLCPESKERNLNRRFTALYGLEKEVT